MKIKALQKVTLIDYPDQVACTIFLFGCNFRCGFCHNPELVLSDEGKNYSADEILWFLEKRKDYLDGVCITGGEPLLTLEKEFIKRIKEIGYLVKIDTNGSFPEKLSELLREGLVDFVSMDIKNCKEKYSETTRVDVDISKIEESISLISKMYNYEFRTTIVEGLHSVEDLVELSRWVNRICEKKPKKFCIQGFKNNKKFISEKFSDKQNTKRSFLEEIESAVKDYFEKVKIRA